VPVNFSEFKFRWNCFICFVIQYFFICLPSDSTMSEDAGIEPRTVATLAQAEALTTWLNSAGTFFMFRYTILLHPSTLRYHCAGGCWDRTQDCCDFAARGSNHTARSYPLYYTLALKVLIKPVTWDNCESKWWQMRSSWCCVGTSGTSPPSGRTDLLQRTKVCLEK
jgi:hypothetical protein